MASVLSLRVVSPEKVVFQGEAAALVAPAWDGKVGILPGHAPFLTLVGRGKLVVDLPGGGSETFWVAGGVLKVLANEVTVLSEYATEAAPDGSVPPGWEERADQVLHDAAVPGNPLT